MTERYLPIQIYKFPLGEATNGGASSKEGYHVIPHPNGQLTAKDINDDGTYGPNHTPIFIYDVVPAVQNGRGLNLRPRIAGTKWTMMGGNFGYTSDSRFREVAGNQPVAIHDRIEG